MEGSVAEGVTVVGVNSGARVCRHNHKEALRCLGH